MQGYSVTEAASVLGVPTERVWELLARGVLSGAPEGDTGMRVYLQPRPAPAPVEAKTDGNGGSREPERELSPFRELLTEFRNLTERYGQALLALGEARGEVASLRSRVDLLEARMDLRLPAGQASAWSSAPLPPPTERPVAPTAPPVETSSADAPEAEAAEEERRARARGPRRATESFAEALARAEDPSIPELPPRTDSAPHSAPSPTVDTEDLSLPREVAEAESIPVDDAPAAVEELPAAASAEAELSEPQIAVEPESEPESLIGAADASPQASPAIVEPEAVEVPPEPEPESAAEPTAETEPLEPAAVDQPDLTAAAEEAAPAAAAVEPAIGGAMAAPEGMPQAPSGEPMTPAADDERNVAMPAPAVEPIEWDVERYTTDIEEPDWFAAEVEEQFVAAVAPPEAETQAVVVTDEETILRTDRGADDATGADEMEVAPTGTQHDPDADRDVAREAFPGSNELEDALAALGSLASSEHDAPTEADAPADPGTATPPEPPAATDESPRRSSNSTGSVTRLTRPPTGVPSAGPASRAYRRLRRIFPD